MKEIIQYFNEVCINELLKVSENLYRDPSKFAEYIEELKETIVQQGISADKQTKSNTRLTYLALVFAFISIVPVLREYIPIFETKNHDRDVYELKNKVLSLSNTNLENQVRILKMENELLKAKTASEKEKKLP